MAAISGSIQLDPEIHVLYTEHSLIHGISADSIYTFLTQHHSRMADWRAAYNVLRGWIFRHCSLSPLTIFIKKLHRAACNLKFRMMLQKVKLLFKPLRYTVIVAIHSGDIVTRGSRQAVIQRLVQPQVLHIA